MNSIFWIFVFTTSMGVHLSCSLQIRGLRVPPFVKSGSNVTLECLVDIQRDILYSLSWYRENQTFYEYAPHSKNKKTAYRDSQITVDLSQSSKDKVMLTNVSVETSGNYKCEVVADVTFEKWEQTSHMQVVDVRHGDPVIEMPSKTYRSRDTLRANCTSPSSRPMANITWGINNKKVPSRYSHISSNTSLPSPPGFYSPKSMLLVRIHSTDFLEDTITVSCSVSIGNIYLRTSHFVVYKHGYRVVSPLQKLFGTNGDVTLTPAPLPLFVSLTCLFISTGIK